MGKANMLDKDGVWLQIEPTFGSAHIHDETFPRLKQMEALS